MSKNHSTVDKSFGFEKINGLFEKIKKVLKTIAEKEVMLENPSIVISDDVTYSNFEEMELFLKAETSTHKKIIQSITFFKWALILFESFGGYLAFGLLVHQVNLYGRIDESFHFLIDLGLWIISFGFSHYIINFAMRTFKPKKSGDRIEFKKYLSAFGSVLSLPLMNVVLIYGINLEVDNKEIYLISMCFTICAGILLLLRNSGISEQEQNRMQILKDYQNSLEERKKLYGKARDLYLQIFKQNNKYDGFIENFDSIDDRSTLYAPLKEFLKESSEKGFDVWSEDQIELQKSKLRFLKNRN